VVPASAVNSFGLGQDIGHSENPFSQNMRSTVIPKNLDPFPFLQHGAANAHKTIHADHLNHPSLIALTELGLEVDLLK